MIQQRFWKTGTAKIIAGTLCAHYTMLLVGIIQGFSAILLPQLKTTDKYKDLTEDETSWIVSLGTVTNPIGSLLSGVLAEFLGRKRSIQLAAIPVIVGSLLLGLAQNVNWIYAGRLITGIAGGMSPASYTYVGEVSTSQTRGIMQTLGPTFASIGIMMTYIFGYFLHWTTVAYISIGFAILSIILMELVPESPSHLLRQGKKSEGFDILLWYRCDRSVAHEEIDRFYQNQKEANSNNMSFKDTYFGPQTIKPFLILLGLFAFQEFSGIYTLLFYVATFFEVADPNFDEILGCIIVGAIRLVMAIVAGYLVNTYGRKILCTCSSIGMAITIGAVATYLKYYEIHSDQEKVAPYLPLIGMILYVACSNAGLFPIPWVMIGELFPVKVRPIMSGIVVSLAQLLIFICVKVYENMTNTLNLSGTLFVFIAVSLLSAVYCITILIETRNKTLEEIEAHFRGNKKISSNGGIDNVFFDNSSENLNNVKNRTNTGGLTV